MDASRPSLAIHPPHRLTHAPLLTHTHLLLLAVLKLGTAPNLPTIWIPLVIPIYHLDGRISPSNPHSVTAALVLATTPGYSTFISPVIGTSSGVVRYLSISPTSSLVSTPFSPRPEWLRRYRVTALDIRPDLTATPDHRRHPQWSTPSARFPPSPTSSGWLMPGPQRTRLLPPLSCTPLYRKVCIRYSF